MHRIGCRHRADAPLLPMVANDPARRPRRVFDLIIFGQSASIVLNLRMTLLCDSIHRGFIAVADWSSTENASRSIDFSSGLDLSACPKYSLAVCQYTPAPCPRSASHCAKRSIAAHRLALYEQQFECLREHFKQEGTRRDLGIVTEHDEIPFPSLLQSAVHETRGLVTSLFFYYHVECMSTSRWDMGVIATGDDIIARPGALYLTRDTARRQPELAYREQSWHFSTFMTPEEVVRKNAAASLHPECNRPPFTSVEWQREAQRKCVQFCGGERLRKTPASIRQSLPPPLLAMLNRSRSR